MSSSGKRRLAIVLASIALATTCASAAEQWCTGTVSNLFVSSNGNVEVQTSWLGNYVLVCNQNQTSGGVSPTTCLSWMSLLRNAIERKAQTTIYYPNAPACAQIPPYETAPTPGYVMLVN